MRLKHGHNITLPNAKLMLGIETMFFKRAKTDTLYTMYLATSN